MVDSSKSSTNEWSNPKDPVVIPSVLLVVDNGGSKTPGRVDAGSGDGDGGQVNQEHCKTNGKRGQNLHTDIYTPS